ncbi:hypothetical protein EMMF5_001836 [Cystobasidiomycetes sp. EMM_F5]
MTLARPSRRLSDSNLPSGGPPFSLNTKNERHYFDATYRRSSEVNLPWALKRSTPQSSQPPSRRATPTAAASKSYSNEEANLRRQSDSGFSVQSQSPIVYAQPKTPPRGPQNPHHLPNVAASKQASNVGSTLASTTYPTFAVAVVLRVERHGTKHLTIRNFSKEKRFAAPRMCTAEISTQLSVLAQQVPLTDRAVEEATRTADLALFRTLEAGDWGLNQSFQVCFVNFAPKRPPTYLRLHHEARWSSTSLQTRTGPQRDLQALVGAHSSIAANAPRSIEPTRGIPAASRIQRLPATISELPVQVSRTSALSATNTASTEGTCLIRLVLERFDGKEEFTLRYPLPGKGYRERPPILCTENISRELARLAESLTSSDKIVSALRQRPGSRGLCTYRRLLPEEWKMDMNKIVC